MRPGEHKLVACRDPGPVLDARRRGLSVRDTILVAMPGVVGLRVLVRAPIEGTVASNVMQHGAGALDVDSCRVAVTGDDAEAMQRCNTPGSGRFKPGPTGYGTFDRSSPSPSLDTARGRWPTNLVFIHSVECQCTGTRVVPSHNPDNKTVTGDDTTPNTYGKWRARSSVGHASEDGTEAVADWDCVQGCLVRALDLMSGVLQSGTNAFIRSCAKGYRPQALGVESRPEGTAMICYGDKGGASRFYPQFKDIAEADAWFERLVGLQ